MKRYHATFLSRNERGQYENRTLPIVAHDFREAISWLLHGDKHGKWTIESDTVTVERRDGERRVVDV